MAIGLILDHHGWARIDDLLDFLNRKEKRVDRHRFRISEGGKEGAGESGAYDFDRTKFGEVRCSAMALSWNGESFYGRY